MTELEKCLAGEYYDCHDQVFLDFKARARRLLQAYNALAYEQKEEKGGILIHVWSLWKHLKRIIGRDWREGICGIPFYL